MAVGEPWPVCTTPHRRAPGPEPLPLLALAQLRTQDVPDLPAGPDGCDLLQVFWCPFDAHGPTGYGMYVHLRWRRAAEVRSVAAQQPRPPAVGFDGYLPEPCVLHPEQVTEYPYIELLTGELGAAVEEWEDAQEEAAYEAEEEAREEDEEDGGEDRPPTYQSDLSVAPGWKAKRARGLEPHRAGRHGLRRLREPDGAAADRRDERVARRQQELDPAGGRAAEPDRRGRRQPWQAQRLRLPRRSGPPARLQRAVGLPGRGSPY